MSDFVFTTLHSDEEHLPVGGRVTWVNDRVTRVRLMFYPVAMGDLPDIRWDYNPPPAGVTVSGCEGDRSVSISDGPIRVVVKRGERVALDLTVERWSRRRRDFACTIRSAPGARFYGLGGRFLGVEHSGKDLPCESSDPWGEHVVHPPQWSNPYYPVPYLFCTDGRALLFHATAPMRFVLPARKGEDGIRVEIGAAALDLTLIETADPAEAVREYLALTGAPYIPPRWAMEPLMGHASDHKGKCFDERVLGVYLDQMREHAIPNGIIFDETWAWAAMERGEDGRERLWFHPEQLGDFTIHNFAPEAAGIERAHAAGQKYVLHISPFIGIRSRYVDELSRNGWLVRRASDPTLPLVGQYHHCFLDFTHSEAVAWWQDGIRRLLRLGVDGFFADFGESDDQRDALYFEGTGATRGQEYCVLMRRALWEACREARGDDVFLISRAGWTGMQQYAGALIGDQPGTFVGMRLALSAMQSLSMSGQAVSAHNLGGYAGQQERMVYLRWMQLGVVSPMFVMWNSGPTGEPWTFDEDTRDEYAETARLRMRLLPYLHSCLCAFPETGLPLVRPMAMLWPDDPAVADREDQFFCGSELLAAPIFSLDGKREVWLPEGEWHDFWTGERFEGGRTVLVEHPIETFPLFVRAGGIVPMEASPVRAEPGRDPLEVRLYGRGDARFRLHDHGRVGEIFTRWSGDTLEVTLPPLDRPTVIVRGYGLSWPVETAFEGTASLPIEQDDTAWAITVRGSGGTVRVRFT